MATTARYVERMLACLSEPPGECGCVCVCILVINHNLDIGLLFL